MTTTLQVIFQAVIAEWTNIAAATTAVAAFVLSIASYRTASRALWISEQQEQRKRPQLFLSLLDSSIHRAPQGESIYSFWLSIRNPTDSDNALALIEMHIRYVIVGGVSLTVKLPTSSGSALVGKEARLVIPSRVAAHDTISGWCEFILNPNVINGHTIDGYQIVLTDSHQAETSVEAILVTEKRHAI